MKSVNFFSRDFLTHHAFFFFFCGRVKKLSQSIKLCDASPQFVGRAWEENTGGRRKMLGSSASPLGQGESASLMACSLCRCHLVIILRKPSASCSCRAWALGLLGRVWLAGSVAAFPSILTRSSNMRPKGRGWFRPEGGQRTHKERQKKRVSFEVPATTDAGIN